MVHCIRLKLYIDNLFKMQLDVSHEKTALKVCVYHILYCLSYL